MWGFKGLSASYWSQARGVDNPGLVSTTGETGVSVPATEVSGGLSCHSLGWEWRLSQKITIRRNQHEWSKWGAQCQHLEEALWQVLRQCDDNCLQLLHTGYAWVTQQHTSIWTNQQEGGSGSRVNYRVGGESMLDKYASTACLLVTIELDQPVMREPLGPVRGPGIWAGLPGRQKDHAGTYGTCECTCVHEFR